MKQSKFNVLITPESSPRFAILYNTFHDHRIVIENTDFNITDFFKKISDHSELSAAETETANTFFEMGILLADDVDERQLFDDWYVNKVQNASGRLSLIVLTTMACNLRCPYCYEKDQLDNSKHMSLETTNQLINWVKSEVRRKAVDEVEIIYFGGEPLMNKKMVLHMSGALRDFCKTYGIHYQGSMVSNGVLMTPAVAKELRGVGLTFAKITLDGDKAMHDTTRITSSGRGSFDQIFFNLEHANDDLAVGEEPMTFMIGGNFSPETYDGFFPLLDRLAAASFRPYIKSINLKPVQNVTSSASEANVSSPCDVVCFNEDNTTRMIQLRAELAKRGLPALDGLNLGPCDFYRGDSYTVGINGGLYPCIAFVDNEKAAVGHVQDSVPKISHLRTHQKWLDTKPWTHECYNCSFLPVCTGGCRATAVSNGRSWSSTVCEKEYFKRIAKALASEILEADSEAELEVAAEPVAKAI